MLPTIPLLIQAPECHLQRLLSVTYEPTIYTAPEYRLHTGSRVLPTIPLIKQAPECHPHTGS